MGLVEVTDTTRELDSSHVKQFEAGQILYFPRLPIEFSEDDWQFLLRQRQTGAAFHKNIAYRPAQDILTGVKSGSDRGELRRLLKAYCDQAARLLRRLLPRYAEGSRLDFTSYRPFEEAGRDLSLHSRNDLLHVDAFPTRPTNGDRILRFFTNLNPTEPRVWLTSDGFEALSTVFALDAGLAEAARRRSQPWRQAIARFAGLGLLRQFGASPYDTVMHRFHNFLKENRQFQETCTKNRIEFPPRSSWMVFTDMVSHAVLSGRFALEQTFIISRKAMLEPERAPVSVLERLTGASLTWQ
jgi:hypothetical protein